MNSSPLAKCAALAGAVLLLAMVADTLVPVAWQVRLGLHWLVEHFLAYFALSLLICLAWPRPLVVGLSLAVLSGGLEAAQGFTSDRIPDLATAVAGAAGALAGALAAGLIVRLTGGLARPEARP
jgi:VanZ family protein